MIYLCYGDISIAIYYKYVISIWKTEDQTKWENELLEFQFRSNSCLETHTHKRSAISCVLRNSETKYKSTGCCLRLSQCVFSMNGSTNQLVVCITNNNVNRRNKLFLCIFFEYRMDFLVSFLLICSSRWWINLI